VSGNVHIDGVDLHAGQVWLYAPKVPQRYTLLAEENTVYGYVHFTGSDVENLLESLGIETHAPLTVRPSGFHEIFSRLCEDMREEDALSAVRAEYHTLQLLSRLAVRRSDTSLPYRIQRATEVMEHAFAEPFDAAQYAAMLGVSVSRFNHVFRETVGVSPYAYYVRLRMDNACGLLSDTTLSIGEIAHRCGYEDALYFTQVFRRQMGVTPTAYRKENRAD
jgi:AraC-like DNA-binding protein